MNRLAIFLLLELCAVGALAQPHSWLQVQELPTGAGIVVVGMTGHRFHCDLVAVDSNKLIGDCSLHHRSPREVFTRGEIRQVRRVHPLANRFAGFALGAGIAAIGGLVTLGEAGAPLGAAFFVGGGIPVFPTTLVYQQPKSAAPPVPLSSRLTLPGE